MANRKWSSYMWHSWSADFFDDGRGQQISVTARAECIQSLLASTSMQGKQRIHGWSDTSKHCAQLKEHSVTGLGNFCDYYFFFGCRNRWQTSNGNVQWKRNGVCAYEDSKPRSSRGENHVPSKHNIIFNENEAEEKKHCDHLCSCYLLLLLPLLLLLLPP